MFYFFNFILTHNSYEYYIHDTWIIDCYKISLNVINRCFEVMYAELSAIGT